MVALNIFAKLFFIILPFGAFCKKDDGIFDDTLINNFEIQWQDLEPIERQELLSKTGKIAFFVRLYRAWTVTPNGQKGFINRFPDPPVPVPKDIIRGCTRYLKDCIRTIYNNIQKRAAFLFPLRDHIITDFVFDEDRFRNLVGDSMFAYDVSIAYIMCFFVKNRISLMTNLPFCSYGVTADKKQIWPSSAFRDAANNPFIDSVFDVIDDFELGSYADFACAEESFCPDPCCQGSNNETCYHQLCTSKDLRRNHESNLFPPKKTRYPCRMDPRYNDNFWALSRNQWNISCDCPQSGHLFRFDTLQCVDIDECDFLEDSPCSELETCMNTIGGFECVCIVGYYRNPGDGQCNPIEMPTTKPTFFGIAHAPPKVVSATRSPTLYTILILLFVISFLVYI